ncbi:MAG: hypothetical protein Q4D65_01120 [Peptostreptococcaceae bacterium]|nr:hypothetical protein [Peptostreptococcaceae bacterium]
MENKNQKWEWQEPTPTEKRKAWVMMGFLAFFFILSGLFWVISADWGLSTRDKTSIIDRIAMVVLGTPVFLQYLGVPIFYPVDKKRRMSVEKQIVTCLYLAAYLNAIPIVVKALHLPMSIWAYFVPVLIIQTVLLCVALVIFITKTSATERQALGKKFGIAMLFLVVTLFASVWLNFFLKA